jgi:class 3 adenylate cyclase/tetratricopeptide (TPR) repeat protein
VICPSCQNENPEGMNFCGECGTALALRCASCGAVHPPAQKFCGACGAPLGAVKPAGGPPAAGSAAAPVSGPAVVSAEMRLVSVLFVDLVGFTSLSEGRDAEDVRELLGRYFDSARTIVERYGGTIEKFIGDAVMAVWGVPLAREDDAERAVRAALDVVDAVRVFGTEVGAAELRARAGVVTGQVAALENPGEGLVVGDRVNTASRVQSAAQPGSVLVDEVTRGVTSASIVYEDAGEHSVKGKAEPLRLWRAARVVAGVAGKQRAQGLEAPFVGRDGDLRLLKELFHSAQERRSARLVAVFGEAGIGKSRLLREFSNYTDGLAATVLWHSGRCLSYGEGVAYWALGEMVRQRFGIPEDAGAEAAREELATGLERWVADAADREFLTPRLGALLGLAEPGLSRGELFAGWRMFFERLATHEPVALIFEDLQWAEEGLLDFIDHLLDWSASSPIFILTLARPDLTARHPEWPTSRRGATIVQLEPLDQPSMRELLAGVVPDLPPPAARQIVERAEGVPLYAVETLRALAARGVLVERDGRLVLAGELGELDVPASLGSLLAARIDALEPGERQLVKAMSVFGGSFPQATAAALAGVGEDELAPVLTALVRKQVLAVRADPLSPDRGQFVFAQGLLRTVAYEMLSRQERRTRHLAAAEHLRQAFPNDGEEVAEAIATHLVDAHSAAQGDAGADEIRGRAVAALRRAAQRAAAVGAPGTAARTYLTAREMTDDERERTELAGAAAAVTLQSGDSETAVALFEEAITAHLAAGQKREAAALTLGLSSGLSRLGRLEEAADRLRTAIDALGAEAVDPDVGRLSAALGRMLLFAGHYEDADAPVELALRIAAALELPDVLVSALMVRATGLGHLARIVESRALFSAAIEIAGERGLSEEHGRLLANLGNICLQWDLLDAEEHYRVALSLGRRHGQRFSESVCVGNLATAALQTGRWDEVEELCGELLEESPDRPGKEFVHLAMVRLDAYRGRVQNAAGHLAKSRRLSASGDPEYRTMYGAAEVVARVAGGAAAEAVEVGRRVIDDALEHFGVATDAMRMAWPEVVTAALELGRLDDARALIDRLGALPPGHVPPYLRAELARARGRLADAEGRHDEVEPQLTAAVEKLKALGYPYHLALAQTDLARWLFTQDRREEAEPLLEEASATLRSLGAAPALARAQALGLGAAPADALAP